MLPKNNRVKKELFLHIMKDGGKLNSSFFVFRFVPSQTPQFAFVAPKSVTKLALKRNKLRRSGYNALRSMPLKKYAGIFFYKKGAATPSTLEIKNDIEELFKKLK